jgi:hypothetical protein
LSIRKNYFSIRDFLLINVINIASFRTYVNTLNDIIKKYNEYINDDNNQQYKNTNSLEKLKDKSNDKTVKGNIGKVMDYIKPSGNKNTPKDDEFISLFNTGVSKEDDWKKFIIKSQLKDDNLITNQQFSMENILGLMILAESEIYLKNNYDENVPPVNSEFNIEDFIVRVKNRTFYNDNIKEDTVMAVVDFRKQRALLENQIQELKQIIKLQQEIVQLEINEQLFNKSNQSEDNFKPTIRTCFEILANNTQAMLKTVQDITKKAEDKSISGTRKSILSSYSTDIPKTIFDSLNGNTKGIAWPSIYESNDDGTEKEIYIGSIAKSTKDIFPEYEFVEKVFNAYLNKREQLEQVTKSSTLKSGLDTDNWFPINPMDYKENPFIRLRGLNTENEIKEYFVQQILTRVVLLKNYSEFNSTTGGKETSVYAKLDAINAYETVKINNNTVLLLNNIITELKNKGQASLFLKDSLIGKTKFFTERVEEVKNSPQPYFLKEDILPKISGIEFGLNYNNPNINYVLFDESEIINNNKNLWESIKQAKEYGEITDSKAGNAIRREEKTDSLIYKTFYLNNNLYSNINFNVWENKVGKNILSSNDGKIETLNKTKITDIDILVGSADTIGAYLNKTYFNPNDTEEEEEDIFTSNTFYGQQNIFGKAYLLLSTIPFRNFKEGFLKPLFPDNIYTGARIVELPSMYIYYLGALLWRYSENNDPINWNGYIPFETNKNEYPTKIGYLKSNNSTNKVLEDELIKLPISVKNELINKFKSWVTKNNFTESQTGKFESDMDIYTSNLTGSTSTVDSAKRSLLNELTRITKLIILNPFIFNPSKDLPINNKLYIDTGDVFTYIEKFAELFSKKSEENSNTGGNNVEAEDKKLSDKNKNDLKLQIYNYFKNINDKWVAGNERGAFNACGDSSKNLIEYFKFIDRGWRDIGNEAVINLNSFLSLGNNQDTSVYFFMSKLLRDSNFLFQILPTYINYKDSKEIAKIFRPQTVLESPDSSGPIYCCIYVGGASQVLDIKETNNYYFNNDGFAFKNGQLPADIADAKKSSDGVDDFSLVAFRVAFGAQNQTIFKNVSLNQQEHKETGEYFKALGDLIDKRGSTQKTYQGTDLLKLFKTRSYTCQVDALGCMNIQPLMYFDLQNVPFFNGAYLITSVSHSISPNTMSTNFSGVRQSKYISPPVTTITADIDIDLNESNEIPPIEFTNLTTNDPVFSIGINSEVAGLQFDFTQITTDNLKQLGVDDKVLANITDVQTQIINPLKLAKIETNAEVAMFLTNVFSYSNNFLVSQKSSSNQDFTKVVTFPSTDTNFPNQTKKYIISVLEVVSGDNNKYFNYTPIASASTTTLYDNTIAYFFDGTDPNLSEWKKVEFSGNTLKTDLKTLKYYNIYQGDEFMFRETGFLPMVGRKQYFDLFPNVKPSALNDESSTNYKKFDTPFKIAIQVWKNLKDENEKTASFYANQKSGSSPSGSFRSFYQTFQTSQINYGDRDIDKSAKVFQKVLQFFTFNKKPLIDFFNP